MNILTTPVPGWLMSVAMTIAGYLFVSVLSLGFLSGIIGLMLALGCTKSINRKIYT